VLYSFYVELLRINLISSPYWEVSPKIKLSARIGMN